ADGGDAGQQVLERLRRLLEGRENVRLIADLEVVVLARPDLVLPPQHPLDLDHRQVHGIQVLRLHGDAPQSVGADDPVARRLEGDEDLLVRVEERALRALLREHADDLERDAADQDLLADQRVTVRVEHRGDRGPDDRHAPPRMILWPGYTLSNVGPSAWIRSCTDFCAPDPSAIIVMTAPTPMMMPSMVSSERSLFARSASRATAMISPSSMVTAACYSR